MKTIVLWALMPFIIVAGWLAHGCAHLGFAGPCFALADFCEWLVEWSR